MRRSEWRISVILLGGLLGTFSTISFLRHELNLTYALGYLAVWVFVLIGNAIYVIYKKNKNG